MRILHKQATQNHATLVQGKGKHNSSLSPMSSPILQNSAKKNHNRSQNSQIDPIHPRTHTQSTLLQILSQVTPKTMDLDHWKFSTTLIITQLVIILAYILTSTYHQDADGSHAKHSVIPAYGGVFPADNPVFRHNSSNARILNACFFNVSCITN